MTRLVIELELISVRVVEPEGAAAAGLDAPLVLTQRQGGARNTKGNKQEKEIWTRQITQLLSTRRDGMRNQQIAEAFEVHPKDTVTRGRLSTHIKRLTRHGVLRVNPEDTDKRFPRYQLAASAPRVRVAGTE